MDRRQELNEAVGLLTRPSKHRVLTEDGSVVWVTSDPLLLQLALALKSTSAGAAFKSSAGTPLPMNADAFDLMEEIDKVIWDHWWQTHGLHFGYGKETITSRLRVWATVSRGHADLLDDAADLTASWVQRIEGLFTPRRTREVQAFCPYCRARKVSMVDEEGRTVKRPALTLIYDREGREIDGAVCGACKYTWNRGDVAGLARFVAAQPDEEDAA